MASVATTPDGAAVGVAMNRFLDLCRAHPDGLYQGVLGESLKDLNLEVVMDAINALLKKGNIKLFQRDDTLVYKVVSRDEIAKFKGLGSEDSLVYQSIQQSANSGISKMDLKKRTNLQQPQVTKALKNLKSRNLIKSVKSVEYKQKLYMLSGLEPSRDVNGGAFYTGQEFDVEFISVLKQQCLQFITKQGEFISVLKQQCLQFITKQGLATLENVADSIHKSGITTEELRLRDYKQILDMLVLDGDVEEEISSGVGAHSAFPLDTMCYKGCKARISESSAFTSIPCGVCPVLHDCTEDGVISPKTCTYFQMWLSF